MITSESEMLPKLLKKEPIPPPALAPSLAFSIKFLLLESISFSYSKVKLLLAIF